MTQTDITLDSGKADNLSLDVAIVGAGVSGLYTGWRLLDSGWLPPCSNGPPKVHVFEMSDRIGGRLESIDVDGITDVVGELGGMRYTRAHKIVVALIKQHQLVETRFDTGTPATHLFYLRGQRFRANKWQEEQKRGGKFQTRYFLCPEHVGFDPDQLFNKIVYDVLTADPWFRNSPFICRVSHTPPYDYEFKLTARDWDEIKPRLTYCVKGPYDGMPVRDLGFWNVIKDRVGEEGYEFLSAAGGYYSNTINWNAAEAFPYMVGDFSDASTSYFTIKGGYDLIARAIACAYLKLQESKIWSKNRLVSFRKSYSHEPRRYTLCICNLTSGRQWHAHANGIVLAMPRRSLELLEQDGGAAFFFQPKASHSLIQTRIASVVREPSFKLLMGFEHPWWKGEFGHWAGASITDLPMRQCYYFGTDPTNGHSLFMASYNDIQTVDFWKALELGSTKPFLPRTTQRASLAKLAEHCRHYAPDVMVHEAMNQVLELHGISQIPDPYVAYYKDWSQDPFGGGYHAWKPGVKVWEAMPYMRQPYPDEAVHICGEAYSDQQGWVEGALCVAERMLQKHFRLAWPSWLDGDYYLGW